MNGTTRRGIGILAVLMATPAAFGQATLTLTPRNGTTMQPGQTKYIDVFVNGVTGTNFLRGFQVDVRVTPQGGSTGTVSIGQTTDTGIYQCVGGTNAGGACNVATGTTDCPGGSCPGAAYVDETRTDYAFFGLGTVAAAIPNQAVVGATLLSPTQSPQVTTPRYLATLVFKASAGANGNFSLAFFNPGDSTFLIDRAGFDVFIPFTGTGTTLGVFPTNPLNDCASAAQAVDGVRAFTTVNATTDGPGHPGTSCDVAGSNTVSNDIWYNYFSTCTGTLTVSTCGDADFNTKVAVYNGCSCPVTGGGLVSCNDDGGGCAGGTSEVVMSATQGTCYKIRVGGRPGTSGTGNLTIACVGNDSCPAAADVSVPSVTAGATINANVDNGFPVCGPTVTSPGVWYRATGTGGSMTASLCGNATFDTRLAVYQGSSCGALSCVAGANNTCGNQESVTWCSTSGQTYYILVHGSSGLEGTFNLNMSSQSCDDANACTNDSCAAGVCSNTPNYNPATQCCGRSSGVTVPIDDTNPCTTDTCNTTSGVVSHAPVPNGPNAQCDDGLGCTLDECFSGNCRNTDVEDLIIPCTADVQCPGDAVCGEDLVCVCGATLEIIPQPGVSPVATCYAVGETFDVVVKLSAIAASTPIVGAQFFLEYDTSTLDFISIEPGELFDPLSPFALEFNEQVNEITGTINYLVGVGIGDPGTTDPSILAVITFQAIAECAPFVNFRPLGPNGEINRLAAFGGAEVIPGDLENMPAISTNSTPPVLTACPADIITGADPGVFSATATWTTPTAIDSCDGPVEVLCDPPSGSLFEAGTTTVTCRSSNTCGIEGLCSFDVTVNPSTLTPSVQLSSTVATGPFTRCVRFELWDCNAPGGPLSATVDAEVTFVNGLSSGASLAIPGGDWECITARDRLHTLRSTSPNLNTINGTDFTASFVGDRAVGGHWLVGGNLNDDRFVDILDFAIFMAEFLSPADPDTVCGTVGPDANVNGDSVVDLVDFVFIQVNSLKSREPNCCGGTASDEWEEAVESISVRDLRRMGLMHLRSADLNRDGVIDQSDVNLFLAGFGEDEIKRAPSKDLRESSLRE